MEIGWDIQDDGLQYEVNLLDGNIHSVEKQNEMG
jgi:hypothetical protein